MKFRQPYDDNYDPLAFATPVGYDLDSDPEKQNINALEASATEQSYKDECDINNIVKSYERTGLMPHQNRAEPVFADISDAPSFLEAQIIVAQANEAFASIPAAIRERFMNDPARLMAFLEDDENYDEAVKLGFVIKKASPAPEPRSEAPAPAGENPPAA